MRRLRKADAVGPKPFVEVERAPVEGDERLQPRRVAPVSRDPQEAPEPPDQGGVEAGLDPERTVPADGPPERLADDAGSGQGAVEPRDPPGVPERRSLPATTAVDDDDVEAGAPQEVRGAEADDSPSDDEDSHRVASVRRATEEPYTRVTVTACPTELGRHLPAAAGRGLVFLARLGL
jgi:hypothetical protein